MINRLHMAMIELYKGDAKRIQHFCKVHSYAKLIAQMENVDEKTLFIPTMNITFFGPCAMHETRLELPSILTSIPSLVIAFALDKNTSASYEARSPSLGVIFERSI